jgi:hypothetical protein
MNNSILPLLTATWLAAVGAGLGLLPVHDTTPGADSRVAPQWPSASAIARAPDKPVLLMFTHEEG